MKRAKLWLAAALAAAALLLGSCDYESIKPKEEPKPSLPDFAAAAEAYPGPEKRDYFNARAGCYLCIDGEGGFSLGWEKGRTEGTYTATEHELLLQSGGEALRAYQRGEGLVLTGLGGIFLPLEEGTGFSAVGLAARFDREYSDEEGGVRRLSDYLLGVGLLYPAEMKAPENILTDAVLVWDGERGYVSGRNVTEDFALSDMEAESFMEDYMRARVMEDFRLIYGGEGVFESLEMLSEGVSGRLASAEGVLTGGGERIYVKTIMYTSTYPDGTVNHICKCFFAPEGDQKSFNALANGVTGMTAVRRK